MKAGFLHNQARCIKIVTGKMANLLKTILPAWISKSFYLIKKMTVVNRCYVNVGRYLHKSRINSHLTRIHAIHYQNR